MTRKRSKKTEESETVQISERSLANLRPWQPGQSGNPGGRPRIVGELKDLAREHTAEAFKTLLDVCQDTEAPPAARVAAAAHILDRGYGKPTQTVNATVNHVKQMTDAELLAFLAGADASDSSEGVAASPGDKGLAH